MESLLAYLPAAACGVMMLVLCIPMMRHMHRHDGNSDDPDTQRELQQLRQEVDRLKSGRTLADHREGVDG